MFFHHSKTKTKIKTLRRQEVIVGASGGADQIKRFPNFRPEEGPSAAPWPSGGEMGFTTRKLKLQKYQWRNDCFGLQQGRGDRGIPKGDLESC